MKLLNAIILEQEALSLNDLSSLQRMTLKRVYDGKIDFDNISDRATDVLDSLVDIGLLNMGYDLTTSGQRAGELIDDFNRRKRQDRSDSSQLAASDLADQDRNKFSRPRTHGTSRFTEGELAAMRGAGLRPSDISKLFEDDENDEDKDDKGKKVEHKCECETECKCDHKSDTKDIVSEMRDGEWSQREDDIMTDTLLRRKNKREGQRMKDAGISPYDVHVKLMDDKRYTYAREHGDLKYMVEALKRNGLCHTEDCARYMMRFRPEQKYIDRMKSKSGRG